MTVMDIQRRADFTTTKHLLTVFIRVTNLLFPHSRNVFLRFVALLYRRRIIELGSGTISFKCVPVPDEFFNKLIPESLKNTHRAHSFGNCVLLNSKSVQTSIETCTLIPITSNNTPHSVDQSCSVLPKRFIEIVSTNGLPFKEAVISETFFYNIRSSFKNQEADGIHICSNKQKDFVFGVQYASKVVVALIHTPNEVHHDLVKHCLTSYFERAYLLCVGDIFVVNISSHMPEAYYVPGHENVNSLYFQVQELEGPPYGNIPNAEKSVGYLVVKHETTLMQTNIKSFIPCNLYSHCLDPQDFVLANYKHSLIPNCPPGLYELQSSLISAIQPFVNNVKIFRAHSIKPVFWLIGPAGSGKHSLLNSLAASLGMHLWDFNCDEVFGKGSGQIEGRLKAIFSKARTFTPCIMVLSNVQSLCKDAEGHEDLRIISLFNDLLLGESDLPLIVVATSNTEASVPPSLARIFLQTFVVPPLAEVDRGKQLEWFAKLRGATISQDCLDLAASRSSGFLFSDLEALVVHALRNNTKGANSPPDAVTRQGVHLTWVDLQEALGKMQSAYSDAIGAPKIPEVTWDDIGGLGSVKEEILTTVNSPLLHPELVAAGLRRSGVLLYGPPGTGKTLIAKAVATECGLNFLSVKGPELLNMYVGQSEENVREVFERARAASPCIIFFDELDSLAPNRGRSGDSGGVMDRVVSQLLSEMDGLQKSSHLFVIGATNRPDLIDPALLRPGRFDKLLYVSACEDDESIACVMRALTRKFNLSADVDVISLAKAVPKQVTGADVYAVCSNAWRNAVRRAIKSLAAGSRDEAPKVEVNQNDFFFAISEMNPSVSADDLRYFKNLEQELFGNKNSVLAN